MGRAEVPGARRACLGLRPRRADPARLYGPPRAPRRSPGWVGGKLNATSIPLEPLGPEECGTLVANLLADDSVDEAVRNRIAEAAEGHPLYAEEITGLLVDEGRLVLKEGRWVASGDLSDVPVPPTISALLAARLDTLPSRERRLIAIASVMGQVFYSGAVHELANDGADEVDVGHRVPRPQAVRATRALRPAGDGGARVPAPADPRRRLRRDPEGDPGGPARAVRGLARRRGWGLSENEMRSSATTSSRPTDIERSSDRSTTGHGSSAVAPGSTWGTRVCKPSRGTTCRRAPRSSIAPSGSFPRIIRGSRSWKTDSLPRSCGRPAIRARRRSEPSPSP